MGLPVKIRLLIPVILTLIFIPSISKSTEFYLPAELPEFRLAYEYAELLDIKDYYSRQESFIGPYRLGCIKWGYPVFEYGTAPGRFQLKPFAIVTEDFSFQKYSRAVGNESIRAGLFTRLGEKLSAHAHFLLDEKLAENPSYSGKKWRGLAGEIETAFLAYVTPGIQILFGRFGSFWGPSDESLILSHTARPMDGIRFKGKWGRFIFTYHFSALSRLRVNDENQEGFINRYFVGHRIDFRAHRNLYIGLFETVIFGGRGRSIEAAYLNPFMFYHAFQLNEDYDDNTFLGFDVTWYVNDRHKFFCQILVDDYQVDSETRGDNEPNETGLLIGVHSVDLFGWLELKAEYLRIANRTYNQIFERNRYVNRDVLIGHQFGPDGDRISLSLSRWFRFDRRASVNIFYQRRGEGCYDDEWTEPWLDVDNYSESFPTGTVEKTFSVSGRFTAFVKKIAFVDCEGGVRVVDNYGHLDGDSRTVPFFNLRFSLLFSTLINTN